jgi:hypothetical protein
VSGTNGIRYVPPGPVAERFFLDRSFVAGINGPIGSGKTTAGLMRHVHTGTAQMQSTRDGMRKYKLCVVRDTYRNLWTTTIPSWQKRFPDTLGRWVGSKDAPAMHEIRFNLADRTKLLLTVEFVGIGENSAEDVLKGYEPTGFHLEEADGLGEDVFSFARGRAGRYPDMDEGGPSWFGVTLAFNAPTLGNYCYRDFYRELPPGWAFFRQPSAFAPDAENVPNLPPGYYDNQLAGQKEWYVNKMLRNQPGVSIGGQRVYPEFNDALHVADHRLEAVAGLSLLIGMDAGGSPAAIIGQRMPDGQWRLIAECIAGPGTGPRRFGADLAKLLQERFARFGAASAPAAAWPGARPSRAVTTSPIRAWGDPSAAYGADRVADEQDWLEIVSEVIGVRVDAAPTNNPSARQEAVRTPLSRLIDGRPGLLLCPSCSVTRNGFNSGYKYRTVRAGGEERITADVDKNEFSHIHDAVQYLCSAGGEDIAIRGRKENSFRHLAGLQGGNDWDPLRGP